MWLTADVSGLQLCHLLLQTYPQGHPECLKGKRFVISGTLDSLFRHEATDLIQKHSGRVTGSVSGSTSFLLCGENTGNSKYNKVGTSFPVFGQEHMWLQECCAKGSLQLRNRILSLE